MQKALHPTDDGDNCMCQEKEGEENSSPLKIASVHRYSDKKIT